MHLSGGNLRIGRLVVPELSPGATQSCIVRLCREFLQRCIQRVASCYNLQPHTATDFQLIRT